MYMQDDIIMGTLTVRENFHFSAALRLPSNMTFKQRKERVESIIDELGLTKCADTKVYTSLEASSTCRASTLPVCDSGQCMFQLVLIV